MQTDRIVIVGAGVGALYAALNLAPQPVLVISPENLGKGASSAWAQGGIAAAMDDSDSPEEHAKDTIRAGAGIVDAHIADIVTKDARELIQTLSELGAPFDRTETGGYAMSLEAAHSIARVVRVKGDQAGREIMQVLIDEALKNPHIQILEKTMAAGLEAKDGEVTGVWIAPTTQDKDAVLLECPAVLLAGGGSCGLYAITTNPPRIRGQVLGMAAIAGAKIGDPEFVQFHPTALDVGDDPAPLATEALRGEGATLINADGERFMTAIHPDAELAPRDIVARGIFAQSQAGKRPMLDTREAIGERIWEEFLVVGDVCRRKGIDPVNEALPVNAAAHYHMGGVLTDDQGRTSLKNLWACGEVTSTGLHGANRLASNGLLEAMVFGAIVANDIALQIEARDADVVGFQFEGEGDRYDADALMCLRQCMTKNVGVIRSRETLEAALVIIAQIEAEHGASVQIRNMCATATLIAVGALEREESRGGHYRSDFPESLEKFQHRTKIDLAHALNVRQKIVLEHKKLG